jgi:CHRD domain
MKAFKHLVLAVAMSSLILPSCQKDDHHKNVITRQNLPVSGLQEVPQRDTKAYGSLDVCYNKKTKLLTFRVKWTGLTGNPVGSHIHGEAAKGINAGVKFDFTAQLPKTTSGSFTGSVVVDEVAIKEAGLLAGLYYVNIHTPAFPGGEIRGQIEF